MLAVLFALLCPIGLVSAATHPNVPFPRTVSTIVSSETVRLAWLASETATGKTVDSTCYECGANNFPKYAYLSAGDTLESVMRWKAPNVQWRHPIPGGILATGYEGCLGGGYSLWWFGDRNQVRSESDLNECYDSFSSLQFTQTENGCGFDTTGMDYTAWNARAVASPAAARRTSNTFQCMADEPNCRSYDAAHWADDGEQALFECITGYRTNTANQHIAYDCIRGTLSLASGSAATCARNPCGAFPIAAIGVDTSSVSSEMFFGDTTEIACQDGFVLSLDDPVVQCQADGTFSQNAALVCHESLAEAFDAKFACSVTNSGHLARWCQVRRL